MLARDWRGVEEKWKKADFLGMVTNYSEIASGPIASAKLQLLLHALNCVDAAIGRRDEERYTAWEEVTVKLLEAFMVQPSPESLEVRPPDPQCSLEITQGAGDSGPRFACLKLYFPPGQDVDSLVAYAQGVLDATEQMLEDRRGE